MRIIYKQNWVRLSIIFATMLFIVLVLFIVLNQPFNQITTLIKDESSELGIENDVHPVIDMWLTVFGLTFVIFAVGLVIVFLLGAHEEEHEQYPVYRNEDDWRW